MVRCAPILPKGYPDAEMSGRRTECCSILPGPDHPYAYDLYPRVDLCEGIKAGLSVYNQF